MLLPVIMAGGTGSRLWPMSRELYPKQFLRLFGQNSMLQETITRLSGLEIHEPMVICNEEHRFLVAEQLRQLNKLSNNIILEPVGRNTAPAIALAALQATRHGDDPLMLVLAPTISSITSRSSTTPSASPSSMPMKAIWSPSVSCRRPGNRLRLHPARCGPHRQRPYSVPGGPFRGEAGPRAR